VRRAKVAGDLVGKLEVPKRQGVGWREAAGRERCAPGPGPWWPARREAERQLLKPEQGADESAAKWRARADGRGRRSVNQREPETAGRAAAQRFKRSAHRQRLPA